MVALATLGEEAGRSMVFTGPIFDVHLSSEGKALRPVRSVETMWVVLEDSQTNCVLDLVGSTNYTLAVMIASTLGIVIQIRFYCQIR